MKTESFQALAPAEVSSTGHSIGSLSTGLAPVGATEAPRLAEAQSLYDFFQTEMARLVGSRGIPVEAQLYLANLCARFTKADTLFVEQEGRRELEPLAFILKRATETTDEAQRMATLRHLGDVALYTSGFLSDRIEHKGLELGYFIQMGGLAYSSASDLAARNAGRRPLQSLYVALSTHFKAMVHVLWELAGRANGTSSNLLKAYDDWRRTGSERKERELVRAGFVLTQRPVLC